VTVQEYRRKPGVVRAIQWTGDNLDELLAETSHSAGISRRWPNDPLNLKTIDGEWVPCPPGHWVVFEPEPDRFYPCDPTVFADRYEPVQAKVVHDPAVGDPVLMHGVIRGIGEGVATVDVYRSWPLGASVDVQCGALECDERAAHGDDPQRESR
jgi:hypothetical protein